MTTITTKTLIKSIEDIKPGDRVERIAEVNRNGVELTTSLIFVAKRITKNNDVVVDNKNESLYEFSPSSFSEYKYTWYLLERPERKPVNGDWYERVNPFDKTVDTYIYYNGWIIYMPKYENNDSTRITPMYHYLSKKSQLKLVKEGSL